MRLGITRPADQLRTLADKAAAKGITLVPLPLLEIEPRLFDWPPVTASERVDWLAFTSANGVRTFFDCLEGQGAVLDSRVRTAVIGTRTAEALTERGYKADVISQLPYGESMFTDLALRLVHPKYTLVYARAEKVNYDPARLLASASIEYVPLICYRHVPAIPDRNIVDEFSPDDYILFTAPSTVQQFQQLFGKPAARPIAIGRTTGMAMVTAGWPPAAALPQPDVEAVLEFIA